MKPRSAVWEQFTRIEDERGKLVEAECKRCNKRFVAKHGTKSLRKHVGSTTCEGRVRESHPTSSSLLQPQPQLLPSGPGESSCREPTGLDDNEASRDLARMIALHGHDLSVVEDDYFRSFVRRVNPGFKLPSHADFEAMCDGIFDEAWRDLEVLDRLRWCVPGSVSLAVGKAQTPEAREVIYTACRFIDYQWDLRKFVLDALVVMGEEHDFTVGPILAFDMVADYMSHHHGGPRWLPGIRLSMGAYDITDGDFHPRLKKYIDDIISEYADPSCTTTTYVDNVLHSIARCLLPNPDFTILISVDMYNLHLTRQEHMQLLSELDPDYEWAYDEHWCAYYFSLEVLRKRGDFITLKGKELFVQLLCKVWEQVYRGIRRISASTFPTSNLCLAELLKLREILQPELARFSGDDTELREILQPELARFSGDDTELREILQPELAWFSEDDTDVEDGYGYFSGGGNAGEALRRASNIVDKAIQDSYLVWSVPLALDPRYKLKYIEFSFKRVFGSEAGKYISEVTKKINKRYADYIEEYDAIAAADHSDSANATMDTTSADPLEQAWHEHCRLQEGMATQVNSCYTETQTELDRYLQDRLEYPAKDFDILKWWKAHSSEYPTVARMAQDALAMPTCSKLSSDQLAQGRSILRGYSKKPYGEYPFHFRRHQVT